MNKTPNYEPEFHEVKYRLPTGRFICDCCGAPQGQPHKRFCYWNPINKKKDDAAYRADKSNVSRERPK